MSDQFIRCIARPVTKEDGALVKILRMRWHVYELAEDPRNNFVQDMIAYTWSCCRRNINYITYYLMKNGVAVWYCNMFFEESRDHIGEDVVEKIWLNNA